MPHKTILLVEDDPALRDSVASFLHESGYEVEREGTGVAALSRLRGGMRPSLILLDLMMPAMTGWDFLREMRGDPSLDGIPVVVLSGHLLGPPRDNALPAHGFVRKPFEPMALLSEVERAFADA